MLIKVGIQTVGPVTLTTVRLCLGALIFCLFMLWKREWIPMHKDALKLYFVVALIGNTLPFTLISVGEVHVDSSMAAILMGIMPITTFVLAHFFVSDEPMTIRKTIGISLGFVGLITLVGVSALQGLSMSTIAELTILTAALCYSFTTIFVRRQQSFKGYQMATGVNIVAALISIPMAFVFEDPMQMQPSFESAAAIVVLAVFATTIASLIYFRVIANLGATTFSQINYIIPVLGSLWGVLLLGEILETRMIVALTLVLIGIYLIQTKRTT